MEHPAPRTRDSRIPSSWYLPELVALARLPHTCAVDIDQCQFGSSAFKPTRLFSIHCPALRGLTDARPRRGRCGGCQHVALLGLGPERLWKTGAAKVYPSSMCRHLASAVLSDVHNRFANLHGLDPDWDVHQWAAAFHVPLDPYHNHVMADDCMAHGVRPIPSEVQVSA